jgi:dienelactone hydrolase
MSMLMPRRRALTRSVRPCVVALAGVLLGSLAAPAFAATEVIDTPRGRVAGPDYVAAQYGRLADQLQHEDYQARLDAERASCPRDTYCTNIDPYVAAWTRENLHQERGSLSGTAVAYELLMPRQGARSPVDGRQLQAPYPAVLLLPGGFTAKEVYRGVAQGLAATGYAVLSVDPECNVSSCGPPATPDQEVAGAAGEIATIVVPIVSSCLLTGCDYSSLQSAYAESEKTYQAAATAALRFLSARPTLFDRSRIGAVGHSLGAYNAALLAQRTHLPARVRAAVAWDGYGALPAAVTPRAPVQFQVYEGQDRTPHPFQPDESPSHDNASRLKAAGVPTGVVALRSSAHYEVGHLAYDARTPTPPAASRKGERVALDATLAWLDAHLGSGGVASRGRRALLSERLSGAADAVARGQGTEAADGSNVPYRIGGDARSGHLSLLLRSWYDLGDGTACADVVAGCR